MIVVMVVVMMEVVVGVVMVETAVVANIYWMHYLKYFTNYYNLILGMRKPGTEDFLIVIRNLENVSIFCDYCFTFQSLDKEKNSTGGSQQLPTVDMKISY